MRSLRWWHFLTVHFSFCEVSLKLCALVLLSLLRRFQSLLCIFCLNPRFYILSFWSSRLGLSDRQTLRCASRWPWMELHNWYLFSSKFIYSPLIDWELFNFYRPEVLVHSIYCCGDCVRVEIRGNWRRRGRREEREVLCWISSTFWLLNYANIGSLFHIIWNLQNLGKTAMTKGWSFSKEFTWNTSDWIVQF